MGKNNKPAKEFDKNDIQELLRIYAKINSKTNPQPLTRQEEEFIITATPNLNNEELTKLQAEADKQRELFKTSNGKEGMEIPDGSDRILELLYYKAASSPQGRELALQRSQDLAKTDLGNKIAQGLSIGLTATDLISSTQQIREARRLERQSRRPERPAPLTQDPLLKQAIFEAQQGQFDTAKRLAPAQQAILDQYLSDLNQAKTASTGQAGAYGALAQVASTRRGRGAQGLAPMADEIRARDQQRLDALLQMRLNENQNIQQSQSQYYPTDVYAYQQEQQQIGALGSQGRENLRYSLGNLGQQIPDIASNLAVNRRYNKLRSLENQYNLPPNHLVDIEANNRNRWNGTTNIYDYTSEGLDQLYPPA